LSETLQVGHGDAGTQKALALRYFAESFEGSGPTLVDSAAFAVGLGEDRGHGTRPVEVDVRVEVLPVKLIHGLGVLGTDVAVADVLANNGPILRLDQAVVSGMMRPRAGLLDEQFAEQSGYGVVDELAAIVGVEARITNGNCCRMASNTGSSQSSEICGVAATISHWVTSSTALM